MNIKIIQKNKKAYFNYEILEELETGIALVGTEVKSVREGKCSFSDSYITPKNGSLILIGFIIQPYSHGNIFNHKSDRNRMLLAHKQEIKKFTRKVNERGLTIVPLEIYLKGNLIKMKIALARGKNVRDKKEAIKERDLNRDTRRQLRELNSY
ncbi:MAG: SsrA-binding protein SmpB [Spirochaetes bacterium]|uniref:SsrA-binding protein n=1 Tax=Candidatus Ornithospirochaeta stercoripullorum TaxID=2840899 RepID=A0A9D9DZF5_9SPIO|nr:SsrA-binding protein SmpB [Candidatus Ornithospirochaeta stercoripullorum]